MSTNIVEALKALGAKLLSTTSNAIPGDNVCEVIDYIAQNYTPASPADEKEQ